MTDSGTMKKRILFFVFLLASLNLFSNANQRPKLVVCLVVDQMRWDNLHRYAHRYSSRGFNRLLQEGFACENTMINYIPTFTAVGHASLYTGTVPAIHGVVGNEFTVQRTGEMVYVLDDPKVQGVGQYGFLPEGRAAKSPFRIESTTITDELRMSTEFRSKVISVALKDRASVLPGGHNPTAAYWFDSSTAEWVSSSWYMSELPKWVKKFNEKRYPQKYLSRRWKLEYPLKSYLHYGLNAIAYERSLKGMDVEFPFDFSPLVKEKGAGIITHTPYGNDLTLDFAKSAIAYEQLGQGEYTDFLAVSLSSTDYMGHLFGPNSLKMEDAYIKLDRRIGEFIDYLDSQLGRENYLFVLTADHGAIHNGTYLKENKLPGANWDESEERSKLNGFLKESLGSDQLVINLYNYQVNYNYAKIKELGVDQEELNELVLGYLREQPAIGFALRSREIETYPLPNWIRTRMRNGYHPATCGEIQVILKPGYYSSSRSQGASHGTWHPDDAQIPLVWLGWKIPNGRTYQEVEITDVAVTLAALLQIQRPNGAIGRPILPLMEQIKP